MRAKEPPGELLTRKEIDSSRRLVAVSDPPVRLSVVDLGPRQAPAALFLHGGAGHLLQWHNQLSHFSERLRVVSYDMRGHGESEAPPSHYSFEETVADLESLVEGLDLPPRFHLVAHSYGGAVAAEFARRHPGRLLGVTLVATAGELPLRPAVRYLMKLPAWTLAGIQRLVKNAVSTPPAVLKKLVPTLTSWRGWEIYPGVEVRCLVIAGELDWLTRPAAVRRMADLLPDSQFELIKFAGHLPQLERPSRVNRLLERFLEPTTRRFWRGPVDSQG